VKSCNVSYSKPCTTCGLSHEAIQAAGCPKHHGLLNRRYLFDVDGEWKDFAEIPVAGESRDAVRGAVDSKEDRGGV